MKLAYFRKSKKSKDQLVSDVQSAANKLRLTVVGETKLPRGVMIHFVDPVLMGNLMATDMNLLGLMPAAVAIVEKDGSFLVGAADAAVLQGVSQDPSVAQVAKQIRQKLTDLVHEAAGVTPLKATGVKLYSTTTCPYCKMEAAWFDANKVTYEEVHVDLNQAEAEKMVQKTGQMGVPVTEIRYEDGAEEYIVGFDKPQLAQILGVSA